MAAAPQRTGGAKPRSRSAPARGEALDRGADALRRPLRPFLKWAGGKRQLLPALRPYYPAHFGTYHEPFLGSGAVFFDLASLGALRPCRVRLTDVNGDLIGCWRQLRDRPDAVIAQLHNLAAERLASPEEHYYQVRDDWFNPRRARILDGGSWAERYTTDLAAMLIYLNRTGFNGLFRVNSQGLFNVPRGRYKNPRICDERNLRRTSEALSALEAVVDYAPYETVLDVARPRDFVYLDPPYAPLSTTASFTSYTPDRFDADAQRRLQEVVIRLAKRRCHVVLSNSTAPEIAALYDGNAEVEQAGIRAYKVPARRAINSNATRRGPIQEYVITNVARAPG